MKRFNELYESWTLEDKEAIIDVFMEMNDTNIVINNKTYEIVHNYENNFVLVIDDIELMSEVNMFKLIKCCFLDDVEGFKNLIMGGIILD